MARFLFASIPVPAHSTNPLPFAARLIERGHEVLWYSGRAFHDRVAAVGATPLPYRAATDWEGDPFDAFPQLRRYRGPRAIGQGFADVFVGEAAARVADLRPVLDAHRIDAMLHDGLMIGVGMLSELTGVPHATFGDGPLPYLEPDTPPFGPGLQPMRGPLGRLRNRVIGAVAAKVFFGRAQQVYDRTRVDLGLPKDPRPALDAVASPMLHMQAAVPSFDYPRRHLPPTVHWIGALRPDPPRDWTPPAWWSQVVESCHPVVPVTQGSIRRDMTELVVPTLRALAREDVLVVVTTGGPGRAEVEAAHGGPLPANALVTPFVPYDVMFRHASVVVTNGGYTGVTLALAHGVPLVQAGITEEKTEIGARIRWSGVGLALRRTRPEPDAVRSAVRRVLGEPSFRAAAERVRAEMAPHDAGREGAVLLERLAATQAPVTTPVPPMAAGDLAASGPLPAPRGPGRARRSS
jgi:UDP:flavonoid glycosyltransferase YjiC (YdhE family)